MDISVELTFSPLQDDFEPPVIDLIKALRNSGLQLKENPLSTQVYGKYQDVMNVLNSEIYTALEAVNHGVLYMKIVKSNRNDYEPDF